VTRALPVTLRPALDASVLLRRPRRTLPFPLDRPAADVPAGHATAMALVEAGLAGGDEVLVPAGCPPALYEAFARSGLTARDYRSGDELDPDDAELSALLGRRTRALVAVHWLGFPADGGRWRRWSDDHDLLLIEDCSEAWLASSDGSPVGSLGDIAVFNPANALPLPDAAFALVRGRLLRERPASSVLIRRLAQPCVARRRRAHYRALLAALERRVPAPFAEVPDAASPLAFPLEVADPGDAAARLAAAGVEARPLADGPPAWRERVVVLPVHQELRPGDVERIADAASVLRSSAPRRARADLRLDPVDDLVTLREEWSELAGETGNLFATWEWQSSWWTHFGRGRPLLAAACRDARGALAGILPFYLAAARPGRLVRLLGHGAGDRLGPICSPADRLRLGRAFRAAVRARRWGNALVLAEQLPAEESWSALLGGRVLSREGTPVARIETRSWDAFLASRSANLRQQIRRKERKLAREHDLRYRLVEDPDELPAALDALFALHRARWGGEAGTGFARSEAFHRDFAGQALAHGWLRLWLLELEGRPVAAWQGFRYAGADWYYQMGRDPDWERHSVGLVLLAHTLRDCVEAGLGEYRFLRGGEAYKGRFATADPGLETIAIGSGPLGRAALLAAEGARRIPAARRTGLVED
jgi:CelD/BcsL family acetyltransferase involved in cellulose biosynthesis